MESSNPEVGGSKRPTFLSSKKLPQEPGENHAITDGKRDYGEGKRLLRIPEEAYMVGRVDVSPLSTEHSLERTAGFDTKVSIVI